MKKILIYTLTALLAMSSITACGTGPAEEDGALKVVATIFPVYDWAVNIAGSGEGSPDVTLLLSSGVDMHSYQPTAADLITVSSCDIFIYVGGESDAWVADALREAVNKDMIVIDLLEALGEATKEEEAAEGMQEADGHGHGGEEEAEYDEHIWLSLKNAAALTSVITDAICAADPDNAAVYEANAEDYIAKLTSLDAEYQTAVSSAARDTLLFGDRFPFRYLTDDYGLTYYAAFAGCSAETEASFETVTFLAGKLDELGLRTVLTIEGSDRRIAETIISNSQTKDQQILSLDSMQATTGADAAGGVTYLSVMESNLEILKQALK